LLLSAMAHLKKAGSRYRKLPAPITRGCLGKPGNGSQLEGYSAT
jgi:hypothetical protein